MINNLCVFNLLGVEEKPENETESWLFQTLSIIMKYLIIIIYILCITGIML